MMPLMQTIKHISKVLCLSITMTGCAALQPAGPTSDEQLEGEVASPIKSTLVAIGGALILGAVIAHQARNGAKDAVKDAVESANSDQ